MLNFYLITFVLLVAALVCWFLAIRIKPATVNQEQQALAREQVNTHQLRLRELEDGKEHGELDDKEYEASVTDLKRQLLHDLSGRSKTTENAENKPLPLLVGGILFLFCFVLTFYWSNGQFNKLQDKHVSMELLPTLGKRAVMNEGEALTPKELQQFALGLRTKLHVNTQDAVAWLLLGRVTQALNDMESAKLAFEKAYELDPSKVSTQLNYSQILLMEDDPPSMRKAALLLSKVLAQEPKNIDGLLMVGYIAEQMGNMDKAKSAWEVLVGILDKDDPRLGFVEQKLRADRASEIAKLHAGSVVDGDGGADINVDAGTEKAVKNAKITVHLTLSDALADKVPDGATLFVYAKAAQGPPMPAAVIKMNTFKLPLTVELTDANAMMDSYKLSSLKELVIRTRVSQDQDIGISPGELQGQSQVFSLSDTTEISVVINQVL